jgi:hypothetical protein
MAATRINDDGQSDFAILARVLGDDRGTLSASMAHHILSRGFNGVDKARMLDLATRNQKGGLSAAERAELFAYVRVGDLLSILKSRARRVLRKRAEKRP